MKTILIRVLATAIAVATVGLRDLGGPSVAVACGVETRVMGGVARGGSCPNTLTWSYDSGRQAFVKGGRIEAQGSAQSAYHYEKFYRCEGQTDCMAARSCEEGGIRYNVEAWLLLPDGSRASVTPVDDTVCVYPERVVPVRDVTNIAHEEIRKRLVPPTLTSAPPGKTLVNIVTVYSTNRQPEPRIDITTPVPGRIVAVPEYRWDFGDGQTASGPGMEWQSPDDPNQLPGKYLGPVWRTPGTKQVTLTVTWRVQFQLTNVIDVPLEPIVFTASDTKQVTTARAVLVNR